MRAGQADANFPMQREVVADRVLPTSASDDGLGEPRAVQIARLRGCECARSRRQLNWWRELIPDPMARSFRLSPFSR